MGVKKLETIWPEKFELSEILLCIIIIVLMLFGVLIKVELRSINIAVREIRAQEIQYHTWDIKIEKGGVVNLPEDVMGDSGDDKLIGLAKR